MVSAVQEKHVVQGVEDNRLGQKLEQCVGLFFLGRLFSHLVEVGFVAGRRILREVLHPLTFLPLVQSGYNRVEEYILHGFAGQNIALRRCIDAIWFG